MKGGGSSYSLSGKLVVRTIGDKFDPVEKITETAHGEVAEFIQEQSGGADPFGYFKGARAAKNEGKAREN